MEQKNLYCPEPRVITSSDRESGFSRILGGFPDSITMRSGLVCLRPDEAVGIHSTRGNEELLIILEGEGEFIVSGHTPVSVKKGDFFYCPPETEHDVRNNSSSLLKYVYVTSKAV